MSNKEGVYFIYSRFPDGRYIYKIGMTKNLDRRLKEYPQNYKEELTFECTNSSHMEKEILAGICKLNDKGIVKCKKGEEFFESTDNQVDRIVTKIWEVILNASSDDTLRLKRIYNNSGNMIINRSEYRLCNHHDYCIYFKNKIIGTVNLICRDGHPSKSLVLHDIKLFDTFNNDMVRKLVLGIIEKKFFWNYDYYEVVSHMFINHKSFLKDNGFYQNIKFNDESWLCRENFNNDIYNVPLVFAFGSGDFSDRKNKPSELFSSGKYGKRQTIMCRVTGMKPEMTIKEYIYKHYEHYIDIHPSIELSAPWIEIFDDYEGFFCICYKDDFLFNPTKLKYYRTTKALKLIDASRFSCPGSDQIARIDKIGDNSSLEKMMSKNYPGSIINYFLEVLIKYEETNK